ncbi:seryl-tRNA synthetase [Endobacter medicaginis]|uniref:Serine--tRNA ligase n=1 Tax=Endobacter medicaginis TaxID=1181271 RepID=A0A850NRJ9_9PROT|nr:serine--tRNA ligase [Endobacter medicaginis]MBB3173353.1 seryl-tRNA synthetase [Endobacter medicaginis]MCX5476830.1 serine--tRNA ligase [Endobacter medicaginis]NVN30959.1 serine--tRNA ligase [Endobacter medicaginis]
MHDIRALRADPAAFDAALARRGLAPRSAELLVLDEERRTAITAQQEHQQRRNALAKEIGQLKRGKADSTALEAEAVALKGAMDELESRSTILDRAIRDALAELPNRLDPEVPDGPDETANRVEHVHGTPAEFAFIPRQHFELGEALGMMDFPGAAKLAGARFTILKGSLARLERALGQFMIDRQTLANGYEERTVPLLVNEATIFGTGQLPKFADDLFHTTDDRWLIPTAEVPLTNSVAGEIIPQSALPIRLTALTPCFRAEAGSAGRDTRGMLRQHQFGKVEMVAITTPEQSDAEHLRMVGHAESLLAELGLTFRRVLLCAGDTGFSAARTYDLEVWLPGQQAWREISSISNTRDFQARRMNARYRPAEGGPAYLHTLNGSGLAVGRTLIAVMETHQQEDGSIVIPPVLAPYMGNIDRIG